MEDKKGSSFKKVDDHKQRKSNRGRPKKYEEGQVRHSVSWGKKEDEVWEDAADLARTEQTSISQIVLRSLQEYTKRQQKKSGKNLGGQRQLSMGRQKCYENLKT